MKRNIASIWVAVFVFAGLFCVGLFRVEASPDTPVLIGPANGAVDVVIPTTLEVGVSDSDGQPLDVTFYGHSQATTTGNEFTLMVIPDTQYYTELNNGIFERQTEWIVGQKALRNIFFATHEGDIVDNFDSVLEWTTASTSMATLDGVIPYGINVGNHDMSSARETNIYNQYFGPWRYESEEWYKGGFPEGTNNNSYQTITQNGMDFLFLNLEFCPTAPIIGWANGVLAAHPNHRTIVTTHGYLDVNANRNISAGTGGCVGTTNNTQYIWDQLIYPNPQIFLVLAGHTLGESRRTDLNIAGKPVHQLLADYQGRTNGGDGWLRIMTFKPGEDKIVVETYSPTLQRFETDSNSQFTLGYDMDNFNVIGSVQGATSGSSAALEWQGLSPLSIYKWFAKATDAAGQSAVSPIWSFVTEGNLNPVARAGSDQIVTDSDGNGVESVSLNGDASGDQDGTIVSYEWKEGGTLLSTASSFTGEFAVGTHTLVLSVTDNEGASATDTVVVTVQPKPVVQALHVGNIALAGEVTTKGKTRSCRVTATVNVENQTNAPAVAATVAASWSGAYTRSDSSQTTTAGVATFRTQWVNNCGAFTFRVNNLTLSGYVYDSAANSETQDSLTI
jgi:hypothetical protein